MMIVNNNQFRKQEFEKRRVFKKGTSLCNAYSCPIFQNCLLEIKQLQQENSRLKDKINMAIKYYELNQQECVIGRNKDEKLIKEYYLPAQCSKKLLDILKEN